MVDHRSRSRDILAHEDLLSGIGTSTVSFSTPSVAESLTSRLGRDLILIGPGWHTEFRNGLGCSDLAGFCDAQESACIQSFKTCCYERKT